jgi:glycosyltransferase involved in cell wall biosynthesis
MATPHRRNAEGRPSHYLAIYVEPTPYILGLVREINAIADKPVKTLFLGENISQPWRLSLEDSNATVLPPARTHALTQIWQSIVARPDVVHLAGWGHFSVIFALVVAVVLRVPVTIESDTQLRFDAPAWKQFTKALIYPWLFRIPVVLLPGGSRQAAFFRYYGVSGRKIRNAQMTVDVRQMQERCRQLGSEGRLTTRRQVGLGETDCVFVFVGRLVPHKGVADLLQAFDRICNIVPEEVALLVVGDGPDASRVKDAALRNPRIHWVGRLEQRGVIEMLHASDVAVVPSHIEPWGLVVNEAMAVGLPVVASDRVGAVDDLVIDGETGVVYRSGDVGQLASKMETLARDPAYRDRLAAGAGALIAGWTQEACARITVDAWKSSRR